MASVQRLVSPKLPTALTTHTHVDLPGHDLWFLVVNCVYVLPAKLDASQFEDALSKALQLYPHAAGRLRCDSGRWSIKLTNTAVPVDIDYKPSITSDALLNGDWVIQDDVSPFLNHVLTDVNPVNADAPLLRARLTFFDGETSVGLSWHHTLGDAAVLARFTHALSQFYQGLLFAYAAPTFEKHHFPSPSHSVSAEFWPRMPHYHRTCHFSEFEALAAELGGNMEALRWRFDDRDLTELRSMLSSQEPNETSLSKQDCLIAYLISVLNQKRSVPVQRVTRVSSYRDVNAPFIMTDVAGNLVQNVPATVPTDMVGIAKALRHAVVRCSEPDYIHDWISVASEHMLKTANGGKTIVLFVRDEAMVTVHSMTMYVAQRFHVRFNDLFSRQDGVGELCLRCMRSNPVKGEDGVWRARRSMDVTLGIAADLKPRLLETLGRGIRGFLDNERARL